MINSFRSFFVYWFWTLLFYFGYKVMPSSVKTYTNNPTSIVYLELNQNQIRFHPLGINTVTRNDLTQKGIVEKLVHDFAWSTYRVSPIRGYTPKTFVLDVFRYLSTDGLYTGLTAGQPLLIVTNSAKIAAIFRMADRETLNADFCFNQLGVDAVDSKGLIRWWNADNLFITCIEGNLDE